MNFSLNKEQLVELFTELAKHVKKEEKKENKMKRYIVQVTEDIEFDFFAKDWDIDEGLLWFRDEDGNVIAQYKQWICWREVGCKE